MIEEIVDYMIDHDDTICMNAAVNNVCALYFKNNASNKVKKKMLLMLIIWKKYINNLF